MNELRLNEGGESFLDYITAKQAAENWGVTPRRVQDMCRNGEIEGVIRHGREWLIPKSAKKASNSSKKSENTVFGEVLPQSKNVYSGIIELYHEAGSADRIAESLKDNRFSHDIFVSQLAFYRGDFKKSAELALEHFDENEQDISHRIAVGTQMLLCSFYSSDGKLWNRGKAYMENTVCKNQIEQNALDFWLAAGMSTLSDGTYFPEWFRRGDFSSLPPSALVPASYYFIKFLFLNSESNTAHGDHIGAKEMMRAIPLIAEPLIAYVAAQKSILIETYLHLACALAYHIEGFDSLAIPHIDKALDLAMPDKLYTPLAEYRRRFGFLMDDRIMLKYEKDMPDIKRISRTLVEGWTALHNSILGKNVSASLSTREWQTAKLAAYGLTNKEIADRLGVTVNAVKQSIRLAMDKTGAENRTDLSKFL